MNNYLSNKRISYTNIHDSTKINLVCNFFILPRIYFYNLFILWQISFQIPERNVNGKF